MRDEQRKDLIDVQIDEDNSRKEGQQLSERQQQATRLMSARAESAEQREVGFRRCPPEPEKGS